MIPSRQRYDHYHTLSCCKTLDTMSFKGYIYYIIYQPFGRKYNFSLPPRPVHRWDQLARVSSLFCISYARAHHRMPTRARSTKRTWVGICANSSRYTTLTSQKEHLMQQVLEATQIHHQHPISNVTSGRDQTARAHNREGRGIEAADKSRGPFAWLGAIIAAFTKPKPGYTPEFAVTRGSQELPFDRACRIDPFLLAFFG